MLIAGFPLLQFAYYMSLPGTADLIARHRYSDSHFDAWVAARDAAANRTLNCTLDQLTTEYASGCWCNNSIPSGDICLARVALDTLSNLHSSPATIGRFLRRQGLSRTNISSASRAFGSTVSGAGVTPTSFRFPWKGGMPAGVPEDKFPEDLCPTLYLWPCFTLKQCAASQDPDAPPAPGSSTAPSLPSAPPPAPPSPPYKCKKDMPDKWGDCKIFSLKDSMSTGSAVK